MFARALRVTRSDLFLALLSIVSVCALAGAVWSLYQLGEQADTREQERIETDLASCERGNNFRQLFIDISDANEQMLRAVLDVASRGSSNPERTAEVLETIETEAFDPYEAAVAQVTLSDCSSVVVGATTDDE